MSEVNDPMWEEMWYVNRRDGLTMNVQGIEHIMLRHFNYKFISYLYKALYKTRLAVARKAYI